MVDFSKASQDKKEFIKKYTQTELHDPKNWHFGNCYQTAIAACLDMPVNQVLGVHTLYDGNIQEDLNTLAKRLKHADDWLFDSNIKNVMINTKTDYKVGYYRDLWDRLIQLWFAARGYKYTYLQLRAKDLDSGEYLEVGGNFEKYDKWLENNHNVKYIGNGETVRTPINQYKHSIVMKNGSFYHDPHESRAMLTTLTSVEFIEKVDEV